MVVREASPSAAWSWGKVTGELEASREASMAGVRRAMMKQYTIQSRKISKQFHKRWHPRRVAAAMGSMEAPAARGGLHGNARRELLGRVPQLYAAARNALAVIRRPGL